MINKKVSLHLCLGWQWRFQKRTQIHGCKTEINLHTAQKLIECSE